MSLLKKNVTLERDLVRERDPGGRQMKPPMMPTEQETIERERENEKKREREEHVARPRRSSSSSLTQS